MGLVEETHKKAQHLSNLGFELCKERNFSDALRLFKQASELDPYNYRYWYNVAVACDRVGDHEGMERACRKTIECEAQYIKGYVRLAKALVHQGKLDQAAEAISTGLLFDVQNEELKVLEEKVKNQQEELSLQEARRLQDMDRRPDPESAHSYRVSPNPRSRAMSNPAITSKPSPPPSRRPVPSASLPNLVRGGTNPAAARASTRLPNFKDQCQTYVVTDGDVRVVSDEEEGAAAANSNLHSSTGSSRRGGAKDPTLGIEI